MCCARPRRRAVGVGARTYRVQTSSHSSNGVSTPAGARCPISPSFKGLTSERLSQQARAAELIPSVWPKPSVAAAAGPSVFAGWQRVLQHHVDSAEAGSSVAGATSGNQNGAPIVMQSALFGQSLKSWARSYVSRFQLVPTLFASEPPRLCSSRLSKFA